MDTKPTGRNLKLVTEKPDIRDAQNPFSVLSMQMQPTSSGASWLQQLEDWTLWLKSASRPASTIYLRMYHLRRFSLSHPAIEAADVTLDVLVAWLSGHEWSAETRRSYRASFRQFFGWMQLSGRMAVNPAALLPTIKPPRAKPRPTPTSVYRVAMLRSDERVELMLVVAALTGMRRCEIAAMHTEDLVEDAIGYSLRVVGKGGHERIIPIEVELTEKLLALPNGWVFPGQINGHLSPAHVGKLMSRALGPGWTAHTLRHRFATRAYAGERDICAVQELLGHAKIETTRIYTLVPDGALRAAVHSAA